MKAQNLKLIAKTEEDLKIVSAHLQDSIASISDIANLKKNKIFLMQLNRFMWEDVEKGVFRKNKRIRTVLKFENVINVTSKNINRGKKEVFLEGDGILCCCEYFRYLYEDNIKNLKLNVELINNLNLEIYYSNNSYCLENNVELIEIKN